MHCSTVGVQGEIEDPPAKETAPYKPGDHYQESKMEGEKLALRFFEEHDFEGVVVRPVGIYGPGDTRFLKLFKFINNGRFRMIGKGDVLYHLTYVEDLVDGIILAGEKDKAVICPSCPATNTASNSIRPQLLRDIDRQTLARALIHARQQRPIER